MDTPLAPGVSTWPLVQGQTYRLSGILRGGVADQDARNALAASGFTNIVYYVAAPPLDWPVEDLTPLTPGDRVFRATGTWSQVSQLPTAIVLPSGEFVIIEQVWAHSISAQPVTLTYSNAAVSDALPQTRERPWLIAGGIFSFALAAHFAWMAAYGRKYGYRQNPIETSSFVISSPTETVTVTDMATVPEVAKRLERSGRITIRQMFPDGTGRWIVPPPECAGPYPSPRSIPPEYTGPTAYRPAPPPSPGPRYETPPEPQYAPPPRRQRVPRSCPLPRDPSIAGVDVIVEAKRLLLLPALHGMQMPNIRIRRATSSSRTRTRQLGSATFESHLIRLTDIKGLDKFDVYETLSHEMAHLKTGRIGGVMVGARREGGHGKTWKGNFEKILSEGYGLRVSIAKATHGQVSTIMRGRPGAFGEMMECGCEY